MLRPSKYNYISKRKPLKGNEAQASIGSPVSGVWPRCIVDMSRVPDDGYGPNAQGQLLRDVFVTAEFRNPQR